MTQNQILIAVAVALAILSRVPWAALWAKLPSVGSLIPSRSGSNSQGSVDGWDSDAPPPADVVAWADAIDKACPSASDSDKWSYLTEKLSPIQAAIRSQGGES